MEFNFTVRGDRITADKDYSFVEGNKSSYTAKFDFDKEWQGLAKICIVENEGDCLPVAMINDCAELPLFEKLCAKIGVIGVEMSTDEKCAVRISTGLETIGVNSGAASSKAIAKIEKAAEVWEKYLADMENNRKAAEKAAEDAAKSEGKALEAQENSENSATLAERASENAMRSAQAAENAKKESILARDAAVEATELVIDKIINLDTTKEAVKFANDIRLESRNDGIYVVWTTYDPDVPEDYYENETLLVNKSNRYTITDYARVAEEVNYATYAELDIKGNPILEHYATKEELESFITEVCNALEEIIAGQEELLIPDGDGVKY